MEGHKAAVSCFGTAAQKKNAGSYTADKQGRHSSLHCACVQGENLNQVGTCALLKSILAQPRACCILLEHHSADKKGRHSSLHCACVQGENLNQVGTCALLKSILAQPRACCMLLEHHSADKKGRHFTIECCGSAGL